MPVEGAWAATQDAFFVLPEKFWRADSLDAHNDAANRWNQIFLNELRQFASVRSIAMVGILKTASKNPTLRRKRERLVHVRQF